MKKIAYYGIMVILFVVMGVSAYKIYDIKSGYVMAEKKNREVRERVKIEVESEIENPVNWDELLKINPDVVGWLTGYEIDYPILKGEDNAEYIESDIEHNYSANGSLFVDYRIEHPFAQPLTIIYGHRMNDRSMLGSLVSYLEEGYLENHNEMMLYTPDSVYKVKLIKVDLVNAYDEKMYNPYLDDLNNYLDVKVNNNLIMLSTCTERGSSRDDNRIVVWGELEENK